MTSEDSRNPGYSFEEGKEGSYLEKLVKERTVRKLFTLEKGKFFKTDTVAEILDIEPEVIRDLIRKGELYAIKIGKSYRITEYDLEEFLEKRYTRLKK